MKSTSLRIAALAAAMLVFCTLFAQADEKSDLETQVDQAEDAYQSAAQTLEELETAQQQTQSQIGALEEQSQAVTDQLAVVYTALQQAQTALDAAEGAAEAAQLALEEKQAEYDARYQVCKQQLAAMQRLDNGGSIALLSQATSLYELLSYSRVLLELSEATDATLSALDEEAQELDHQRQQAEEAAEQAQQARDTLDARQAELDQAADALTDALMTANEALTRQQAETQAQQALTEEAKQQYEKAKAELDAYVKAQNAAYTPASLYCSLNFGTALAPGAAISCNFSDPDAIDGSPHGGTDFPAAKGTPIYAVADGVVSVAATHSSYGNYVQISHGTADDGNTYATLYAHMSSYCVSVGQTVTKGQVIGYVGNTGAVRGANGGYHLHLELRINGTRVDAMQYIPH